MPSSKARAQQVLQASVAVQPQLPLKHYFALLSYLSSLLVANFLFLPRSSSWKRAPLAQRSSADRPEHPFLTPLTSDPIHTMAWHLLGLAVCLAWWSQHLRTWSAGLDSRKPDRKQYRWATAKVGASKAVLLMLALEGLRCRRRGVDHFTGARPPRTRRTPQQVSIASSRADGSHFVQTSLLAAHLSLLLVWPVIHTYGIPSIYDAGLYDRYRFTRQFCQFK
jgi:phosphatidylinositol glycan class F